MLRRTNLIKHYDLCIWYPVSLCVFWSEYCIESTVTFHCLIFSKKTSAFFDIPWKAAISSAALPFCFIASSSIAFDLYHENNKVHNFDDTYDGPEFEIIPAQKAVSSEDYVESISSHNWK